MSVSVSPSLFRLALITIGVSVLVAVVAAMFQLGWPPPTLANPLIVVAFVVAAVRQRERALVALLVAGCSAALVELWIADPSIVQRNVLHYVPGGPFVVDSPLYMPISWLYIVVQMGVISLWMTQRWGLVCASLTMALVGALNGPGYEYLAQYAKWWTYSNCWMVAGVPIFAIASEAAIGAVLPLFAREVVRRSLPVGFAIGAMLGGFMWLCGEVTFSLVGQR